MCQFLPHFTTWKQATVSRLSNFFLFFMRIKYLFMTNIDNLTVTDSNGCQIFQNVEVPGSSGAI
jgi:hypothetical protein